MKFPLKNKISNLPELNSPGDFGYKRSFSLLIKEMV